MNDEIGQRIKILISGVPQSQIASELNVSGTTISQWVLGGRVPTLHHLRKLCDLKGISLSEFFDGIGVNGSNSDLMQLDIVNAYQRADKENKKALHLIAKLMTK